MSEQAPTTTAAPAAQAAPSETPPKPGKVGFHTGPDGKTRLVANIKGELVEMDETTAVQRAQMGWSADNLDQLKKKHQEWVKANEEDVKTGQILRQFAGQKPKEFERIKAIITGQATKEPEPDEDEIEDDGLTPRKRGSRVPSELELRQAAVEAEIRRLSESLQQRDGDTRLQKALDAHEYLRGDPEIGELAKELVLARLGRGVHETPEEAVAVAVAQLKRRDGAALEADRQARKAKEELAIPRSGPPSAAMPRLDMEGPASYRDREGTWERWKTALSKRMNPNP